MGVAKKVQKTRSGIHKGNSGTFSKTNGVKKEHHRHKNTMLNGYKTIVGQSFWKIILQMYTDIIKIIVLKIFECSEVEQQQNSHDFTV